MNPIPVFLEVGEKRIFAGAVDWLGWYGQGRDEQGALESLLRNGGRYDQVIQSAQLGFVAPTSVDQFQVVERVPGNATTDFGAPDVPPSSDAQRMNDATLQRSCALFEASWAGLQRAYQSAIGKELRKGSRGGGRELTAIIEHILAAHSSYLRHINWKTKRNEVDNIDTAIREMAGETSRALTSAVAQGVPERGARGGTMWQPCTFARRAIWHIVDHIWEIEDRQS